MSTPANDLPISELDECVDRMLRAIGRLQDLPGFVEGLRTYELALSFVPVDARGAIAAVEVSSVWAALADVSDQVLFLLQEGGA